MDSLHIWLRNKTNFSPSFVAVLLANDLDHAHRVKLPGDQFKVIDYLVFFVIES
jgi:hypothetical protein